MEIVTLKNGKQYSFADVERVWTALNDVLEEDTTADFMGAALHEWSSRL